MKTNENSASIKHNFNNGIQSKSQISSICRERKLIEECVAEKLVQTQTKRHLSRAACPEDDNEVFKWFELM